jgi:hypothetical protein
MPYALRKTEHGYGVQNTETGHWKSKDTSKENAEGQMRLLEGVEHHTLKARPKTSTAHRQMN